MKKTIFIIMILCGSTLLPAQNYLISFSGSGLSTTVNTVTVSNLTKDTTITMNGSDTLMLINTSGMGTPEYHPESMIVFPNPSNHQAHIQFSIPYSSVVITEVIDVSGAIVVSDKRKLDCGEHTYRLENFSAGIYWITAYSDKFRTVTKWISTGHSAGLPDICYETGIPQLQQRTSGTKVLYTLPYDQGEILLFKGKSSNHSRVITLVPTQNEVIDFEFISCVDKDNNHYPVVTIGSQTWMAANLKTSKYNDNTDIPYIPNAGTWSSVFSAAYCWCEDDSATYSSKYGALYKWFTIETGKLCPTGWHVPTPAEWNTLTSTLGGDTVAGKKLKETGIRHWDSLNLETTNASGFSARPGGLRMINNGDYVDEGLNCYFWTATGYSASFAHIRSLNYNTNKINAIGNNKGNGISVRCIKD